MNHLWWIIPTVIVILVLVFRKKIPVVKRATEPSSPKSDPSIFTPAVYNESHFKGYTPKGAAVYSYMPEVSARFKEDADRGIQRTMNIGAEDYGFTQGMNHSEYAVSAWPKYGNEQGFLVESVKVVVVGQEQPPSYDQGEFDKDPRPGFIRLVVAGCFTPKFFGATEAAPFKLGLGLVDDPAMTETAAAFETEHALLYKNDIARYAATIDHSTSGHPLLPGLNEVKGLTASRYKCGGASE